MNWVLAVIGGVGLVQGVVWIGGRKVSAGRRLLGVLVAPVGGILLVVALAGVRVGGLLF